MLGDKDAADVAVTDNSATVNEQLIISDVAPYVAWLEDITAKCIAPTTVKQQAMSVLGVSCGAISTLMSSRIAWEFGVRIANKAPYTYLSGIFFASVTGLTIGAGMITMTEDVFRKLGTDTAPSQKLLVQNGFCDAAIPIMRVGLFTIVAGASSLYATYLVDDRFSSEAKQGTFILVIPTLLANLAVNYWSIDKQIFLLYNSLRYEIGLRLSNRRIEMEHFLDLSLHAVLSKIQQLPKEKVSTLYDRIFTPVSLMGEENPHRKLNELSALTPVQPVPASKCKTFTGFVGTCIGAISPYFVLLVTEDAAKWLCNSIGISDEETINGVSNTIGWASYVTLGALSAYTAKTGFEKMYSAATRGANEPCGKYVNLTTIGQTIAAAAATTYRLELSLEYMASNNAWKFLVGVCSVLGPLSTYYWGIDITKDRLKGLTSRKDKISSVITQMIHLLPKMQDTVLQELFDHVKLEHEKAHHFGTPSETATDKPLGRPLTFSAAAPQYEKKPGSQSHGSSPVQTGLQHPLTATTNSSSNVRTTSK